MENATFNTLSNNLAAAIDTGNGEEVANILKAGYDSLNNGEISIDQMAELQADSDLAGYDY